MLESKLLRRDVLAYAGAFLGALVAPSGLASAQSHSKTPSSSSGKGGKGGKGGSHADKGGDDHGDDHSDDHTDDHADKDADAHTDDHADKDTDHHTETTESGGKGKGPKYRGGREVSQAASHGSGHALEDRVLQK